MTDIKYYTVEEVSKIISTTTGTIRKYIRKGELKASKLGRDYKVSNEHLKEFMESKLHSLGE